MVEGGSRILSSFLAAGLVDELIVYLAPTLLGSGTPALNGLGITTLAEAQHWEWDHVRRRRGADAGTRPEAAPPSSNQSKLWNHNHPRTCRGTSHGRLLMFTGIIAEQGHGPVRGA